MYKANQDRYENILYNRCGASGLKLPLLSLGLWHNFGEKASLGNAREMILGSFDMGITHFDIANNYGPPAGSAEITFGTIFKSDLKPYRNEIVVSTKAGYYMWEGPYGEWGSKKQIISSCDQSLKRLGLEYVDIFYHHRPDPETPLEESMDALATLVKQGKALYVGISNYNAEDTRKASRLLKDMGVKCLVHQACYSMFNRGIEDALLDVIEEEKMGIVSYSALAQGLLTNRYFNGIPSDSRAAAPTPFLSTEQVTEEKVEKAKALDKIAQNRGQSLSQMALAWCLRHPQMTSLIIGASRLGQIQENIKCMNNLEFSSDEIAAIDNILK